MGGPHTWLVAAPILDEVRHLHIGVASTAGPDPLDLPLTRLVVLWQGLTRRPHSCPHVGASCVALAAGRRSSSCTRAFGHASPGIKGSMELSAPVVPPMGPS